MNNRLLIRNPVLVPLCFILAFLLMTWIFIAFRAPVGAMFLQLLIRTEEAPLPGSFAKKNLPAKNTPQRSALTLAGAVKSNTKAGVVRLNENWDGKAPLAEELATTDGFIADSCLRNWAVLGPVPLNAGMKTPLSEPVFGIEDHKISCETFRPKEWKNRIFTDPKGILDLRKLIPDGVNPGAPSAFCLLLTFRITKAESRAHLLFSYDGLLRVLLDGREIHPAGGPEKTQSYVHEKPFAAAFELTEGTHTLLLKSFSAGSVRRLRVRFVGQDDTPLFFSEETPLSK